MFRSTSVLLLCVASFALAQEDLSAMVTRKCPENGGQAATTCYGRIISEVMAGVAAGRPDMDVPPLEPLLPGSLNVSVSAGSDQYRMNFLQPSFNGIGTATVTNVTAGNPLSLVLRANKVTMKSPYVNSGRLILIQASGGGVMSNTFGDVQLKITTSYDEPELRNGKHYGHVKDCKVSFSSGTTLMHVDKLNSGNNIAKELYNIFLSASSTEIMALMMPQLNQQLAELFCDITNRVLKRLPLEAILE